MPQAKSIILVAIFILLSTFIYAQESAGTYEKIRKAVEQKNFDSAISELKSLQTTNPKKFTANNYDYLLARLSEKQDDFATATSNYQNVVNRNSILKEYALWHLSQIMRVSGNLLMEKVYLGELALIADKSLLKEVVKDRFVHNSLESGNFKTAIKLLNGQTALIGQNNNSKTLIETVKENIPSFGKNISRKNLALLGEAYLKNKQPEKAKEVFNELINNYPRKNQPDDFALAGAKGLDLLTVSEDHFGDVVDPNLSAEEHFKRATIYQFNRSFSLARLHYEAIAQNHPTSDKAPVSLYQIARGFGQERNYKKAVEWSEKLQKDFPENNLASAALYQTAGAYANLNNTNEAVKRYVKYIDANPEAKNIERAFLNIIDAFRDEKNHKVALQWASKAQERFKGEMGEAVALFSQIRIHISQGNWQNALTGLNRLKEMKNLGGIRIAGGTNRNEVTFLNGFVLEKLSRIDEAVTVYSTLNDGRKNYYGWRASERIRELAKSGKQINIKPKTTTLPQRVVIPTGKILEFGRKEILQSPQKTKSHKTIADELLFLRLYDEGTPELETSLREDLAKKSGSLSDFPNDKAFTLAVFYKRGDMAKRAISYIEPKWKKVPNNYPIPAIPREHFELLYPKPYEESLVKYGKKYDVDPRFILSIMRQESRFQADVKSFAAARGLMQFISNTSLQMADEMKMKNFRQDDLYNPPTAIRFGSHYVNKIFKDFPNQPPAVAASYNGGEDRMMRWFKRGNSDNPDRYIPEVIFSQTKDYVYKVMTNYRTYKMLYDENLQEINK